MALGLIPLIISLTKFNFSYLCVINLGVSGNFLGEIDE